MQIGGYDSQGHLSQQVRWVSMHNVDAFKIDLYGVAMNNHMMDGSAKFAVGFVDSGTTFSYFPPEFMEILRVHFLLFCDAAEDNCKGALDLERHLCFGYDESRFTESPQEYFESFPTLNFRLRDVEGKEFDYVWYPSEYLYRKHKDSYCMACDQ